MQINSLLMEEMMARALATDDLAGVNQNVTDWLIICFRERLETAIGSGIESGFGIVGSKHERHGSGPVVPRPAHLSSTETGGRK